MRALAQYPRGLGEYPGPLLPTELRELREVPRPLRELREA